MNIKNFKVGDTVYILDYHYKEDISNATIEEAVVTGVGRKYVSVKLSEYLHFNTDYKFHNELNKVYYLTSNDTRKNKLFRSMQDLYDWRESEDLYRDVRSFFGSVNNNLTLDQLRRIKNIVDESNV